MNALGFVAFNLFYGLTKAHIDMAAHVGGLLAGVPIGAAMAFDPASTTGAKRLWRSALVCVFSAAILVPVARKSRCSTTGRASSPAGVAQASHGDSS